MSKKMNVVEKTKYSTVCETKNGKRVTFLTPSGKMKRYEQELKNGVNIHTGEPLNDCAAGYRMGYRAALGEQSRIFNKKNK